MDIVVDGKIRGRQTINESFKESVQIGVSEFPMPCFNRVALSSEEDSGRYHEQQSDWMHDIQELLKWNQAFGPPVK